MAIARLLWAQPTTAVVTAVSQSATTVTLLAANANRRGAFIFNDATNRLLLVKLGSGASVTDFSVKMLPGSVFELPIPVYTGLVTGIWSGSGSGTAQVTELS